MNDLTIDSNTGRLTIKSRGWEFGPEMTLKEFLSSEAADSFRNISKILPHYQFRIRLKGGSLCTFILIFLGDILAQVLLGLSDRELTWDDWSLEGERTRQKLHDDFLLSEIGPPTYIFAWGSMRSVLDTRNQEAYIKIEYRRN